tara:strand:+ start:10911 stop:12623 length:1713 start_codon:yes stop_codon:yes gene_type:complete
MAITLFGITLTTQKERIKQERSSVNDQLKSFVPESNDDGAVTIQSGSYYGTYVDMDGVVRNEIELITRYREMAMQPELETAIDEVVNEAIVMEDSGKSVDINMDELKVSEGIKKKIRAEFDHILKLLNFGNMGHDIFRRWYIDGRIFYHLIVDEKKPLNGIQEVRYIDPRRIRKIREIEKTMDKSSGIEIIKKSQEYYMYNDRGVIGTQSANMGAKIAIDSIVNVNSGLMDAKRAMILSYLHKAIKPLNQLRMMEDATVIYRISRAPERRIFYIDVGDMPTIKAEQYLRDIMTKYRNKLVYDSNTGEIKDDRKFMSMLEDIWLPRREGSQGTQIDTLRGGENLGKMEDVEYFQQKLYNSLGVPVSRLIPQQGFSLGRSNEITRDELKFAKFIQRLRSKFSSLFDDLLRVQLVLKKVCTEEEWKYIKEDIWYDFFKDNNFNELKEAELIANRIQTLNFVDPYVGRYYSKEWVQKNILQLTDEDIEEMEAQMSQEDSDGGPSAPVGNIMGTGAAGTVDQNGNPMAPIPMAPSTPVVPGTPMVIGPDGMTPIPQQPQVPPKFELQPDDMEVLS